MPEPAERWWDELRQDAERPPASPRSRTPLIAGLLAAAVLSGGLAMWLASPDRGGFRNPDVVRVQPRLMPVRIAPSAADPEQVRRAYEDFTNVYAASGAPGLARFGDSCAASLKGDPRILDFCLAFDLVADTVQGDGAGEGRDEARRVALVRAALPPGAEPDARIAEVRRLMRQVSGVPEAPGPPARVTRAIAPRPQAPARANLQKAAAKAPLQTARAQPAVARRADPCAGKPRADRMVCAFPALAAQHRQMRAAYDRALAAGADPLEIDRAQAEWREQRNAAHDSKQLSALYAQRIRELSAAARRVPEEPPS
jgi:hypothetical protein